MSKRSSQSRPIFKVYTACLTALMFRKAASANHPGAMLRLGKACLNSEFGMPNTQPVIVEGVNWLKRAVEAATPLYPNAPYELALLHEFGYRDVVFPDEAYAVQLFAKASDLGHADAAYRLGEAYEYGRMGCPEDAGLSIHYYSQSARGGNASAMLSLCAWYMVGAEDVLEKSDEEAFAWAQRAAEGGLAKAEFATGYFLERGVGCKRDALEAWKYYVRAADHGDERAILRLRAGKDLNSDRGMIASSVAAAMESDKGSRSTMSDSSVSGGRRLSHQKAKLDSEEDAKSKDKDCVVM
jgi:TPR repeat protein